MRNQDIFTGMDIQTRNQDLVARHVAGETLTAIGASYGLTRARAQQIFAACSTQSDRIKAKQAAIKVRPEKPSALIGPRGEKRGRLHIPNARNMNLTQRQVRDGIARWLAGDLAIDFEAKGEKRFDLFTSAATKAEIQAKCSHLNIPVASALRGIIAALEKEATK